MFAAVCVNTLCKHRLFINKDRDWQKKRRQRGSTDRREGKEDEGRGREKRGERGLVEQ